MKPDDPNFDEQEITFNVVKSVREGVGHIATLKDVLYVNKLPKTRSGKVARNTLAAMVQGKSYKVNMEWFSACAKNLIMTSI